jgi:hypothetical protein
MSWSTLATMRYYSAYCQIQEWFPPDVYDVEKSLFAYGVAHYPT